MNSCESPLITRFRSPRPPRIEDELTLRTGDRRDYAALAGHHYRAASPATFMRVLVLEHDHPTVVGRLLHRPGERQAAAVLVESMPSLSCRLREEATGGRYAAIRDMQMRAKAVNRELRCISRVVVHPPWRGLGLAVRLVKEALRTATTPMTEAIAAMGRVHPFFEHAGMTAYRAVRSETDARLIAALETLCLSPVDCARVEHTAKRIEQSPAAQGRFMLRELMRWHQRTTLTKETDLRRLLESARQWLLCDPVYYLHGRTE